MDDLLALLTRERDRRAVRDALPAEVTVHFATRPEELPSRLLNGRPAAVLVELADGDGAPLERALEALQRLAPDVPRWLYMQWRPGAVGALVRLTTSALVTGVITTEEKLEARLMELLRRSRSRDEAAALLGVWQDHMTPDAHDIVAACIKLSERAVTVEEVARRLNKSARAIERQLRQAGLPRAHRVVSWCRLLRVMYRLDQPGGNAKTVAAELGYPSSHQMLQHLRRYSELTITGLRAGSRFRELATWIQAELVRTRVNAKQRARRARATGRVGNRSRLAETDPGQQTPHA